jgi:hypothetical protein
MIKHISPLAIAVLALALLSAHAKPAPERVGDLGDVRLLQISGVRSFQPLDLRDALRSVPDVLVAGHTQAPLAEYIEALRSALLAGYQQSGFPHAKVNVRWDPDSDRIAVRVEEGRRFQCGLVRVKGAARVSTEDLIRWLTEDFPPAQHTLTTLRRPEEEAKQVGRHQLKVTGAEVKKRQALWRKGQPAPFSPQSLVGLRVAVTNALAEQGWLFPKFTLAVIPDPQVGVAALEIELREEGPKNTIAAIEIVGAQRDSAESVMRYLGVNAGQPLDQRLLEDLEFRLWNSGRYLTHTVSAEPPVPGATQVKVRIELLEHEAMPPLGADFSPEQKALLQLREWLARFNEGADDLIITANSAPFENAKLEVVVSPNRGLVASIQSGAGPTNYVLLTDKEIGWCAAGGQSKLILTNHALQPSVSLAYRTVADQQRPCMLELGGGFKLRPVDGTGAQSPILLETHFAPAAFLDLAFRTNLSCKLEDGKLVIRGTGTNTSEMLRADASSGKLLHCKVGSNLHLRFEQGQFEARLWGVLASSAPQKNFYRGDQPLSALVQAFAAEDVGWQSLAWFAQEKLPVERCQRATKALIFLVNAETLAPLDRLLAEFTRPPAERFHIPYSPRQDGPSAQNLVAMASGLIFRYCDDLFPKHSWPWTVAREAAFVLHGQSAYTDSELQRLYHSDQIGPAGFLAIAKLLTLAQFPAAKPFAMRGLVRLGAAEFRKDAQLMLEGDGALAQTGRRMLKALGQLQPAELEALAAVLPADIADKLRKAALAARSAPDQPVSEAVLEFVDVCWDKFGKEPTRSALRNLITNPAEN